MTHDFIGRSYPVLKSKMLRPRAEQHGILRVNHERPVAGTSV